MKTVFWGTSIFAASFLVHLALWKVRLPKRQVKTLLILQFSALAASVWALSRLSPNWALLGVVRPLGPVEWAQTSLFAASLILSYMITYTAIEADSPSLVIVRRVEASGARGLTKEELLADLDDAKLVLPRVADLLVDRMAVLEGGRYSTTPKGRLLARIFAFYRNLLGHGMGG